MGLLALFLVFRRHYTISNRSPLRFLDACLPRIRDEARFVVDTSSAITIAVTVAVAVDVADVYVERDLLVRRGAVAGGAVAGGAVGDVGAVAVAVAVAVVVVARYFLVRRDLSVLEFIVDSIKSLLLPVLLLSS